MIERSVTRSVTHATFVIERVYDAAPSRVFAAWATPAAKGRWFVGPDEWNKSDHALDFRVGGRERVSGHQRRPARERVEEARLARVRKAHDAQSFHQVAGYQDIVPDQRIILSYDMHLDQTRISVSLATVEFKPAGAGTRLIYTEQGAFLDGYDDAGSREHGTRGLLDQLGEALRRAPASA